MSGESIGCQDGADDRRHRRGWLILEAVSSHCRQIRLRHSMGTLLLDRALTPLGFGALLFRRCCLSRLSFFLPESVGPPRPLRIETKKRSVHRTDTFVNISADRGALSRLFICSPLTVRHRNFCCFFRLTKLISAASCQTVVGINQTDERTPARSAFRPAPAAYFAAPEGPAGGRICMADGSIRQGSGGRRCCGIVSSSDDD